MHHQETGEKAGRMKRYKVAVVVFATLLRFCRRPEQSAVDPLAEGEEGDAEELWFFRELGKAPGRYRQENRRMPG
ncbi:hypothetical protein NDU88_004051 [Pleurodeles waltl]|uniref:Uncharacterized protein n=1 Tax=Pleurodeles waltl TaxID=8319 RepID=A0AAV7PEG7_PLEWA|nr:hypothetical protein NDU88_004051 [Pleurodeles waltl]